MWIIAGTISDPDFSLLVPEREGSARVPPAFRKRACTYPTAAPCLWNGAPRP